MKISFYINGKRTTEYYKAQDLYEAGNVVEIEIDGQTITYADPMNYLYQSFEEAYATIE